MACCSAMLHVAADGPGLPGRQGSGEVSGTATCGLDDDADCLRGLSHGAQQTLKPVCKNAKGILNNAAGTREAVIEDALFICQVALHQPALHQKKGFINQVFKANASSPIKK